MRFKARDLMYDVLRAEGGTCFAGTTTSHDEPCAPGCPQPSCQGQSGCPQPTNKPPKMSLERLGVLRDQMRQALLPA